MTMSARGTPRRASSWPLCVRHRSARRERKEFGRRASFDDAARSENPLSFTACMATQVRLDPRRGDDPAQSYSSFSYIVET
ncbi:MAG: hypothetical protein AAFW46_17090, partial [Pseudomonadota bacterium]